MTSRSLAGWAFGGCEMSARPNALYERVGEYTGRNTIFGAIMWRGLAHLPYRRF